MNNHAKLAWAIVALLLTPVGIVWNGVAVMLLWRWFVVPVTPLDPLRIAEAIGIAIFAALLTHQYVPQKNDDEMNSVGMSTLYAFARPAFAIGIGWIVSLFL